MISINTNLSSLIIQSNLKTSTNSLNQAIERMTTGFKLNHAKDNAANYSISTSISTKLSAYSVAEENTLHGLNMVQTASENLNSIADLTSRLRSIAVSAQNGTYGNTSLEALNSEAHSLVQEILRIKTSASYNDLTLFLMTLTQQFLLFQNGSKLIPNDQGFLKDIVERDVSAYNKLEDVDASTKLASGTYSISSVEGLIILEQLGSKSLIGSNCEFVLGADIDISSYCKSKLNAKGEGGWNPIGGNAHATFDGNGHTITGLYINRPTSDFQGFTGNQEALVMKNCGFVNPEIHANNFVGVVGAWFYYAHPDNCFVQGGTVTGNDIVGGITGMLNYSNASNCYSTCEVSGKSNVGGIAGSGNGDISNCYSSGNISGNTNVGGITGANCSLTKCATYGAVYGTSNVGIFSGNNSSSINECLYNQNVNKDLDFTGNNSSNVKNIQGIDFGKKVTLQVGIDSGESSQIDFDAWFAIDGLQRLQKMDISNSSSLTLIDNILEQINTKQTEYGAIENRLNSVLEEISTKYDNLASTNSTIKDADMASTSSEYIRTQILQQAAATLLSTANQTPSIALQLL